MTETPILALENARISYFSRAGEVNVIPGLTFALAPGEAMGLVGESGCGKSTVALGIVRYLGRAPWSPPFGCPPLRGGGNGDRDDGH